MTAGGLFVPRAKPLHLYAPVPETSAVYAPRVIRAEPCACGEYLYQHQGDDPRRVVMAHNATPEHREWRQATEAGETPTAVTGRVDVSACCHGASGCPLPEETE